MDFPVILEMDVPEIYAYSIYSSIAEKFEAIVSLGDANSRYKDFYDIYIISERYVLDGKELREAIRETFEHRTTGFDDIIVFENSFLKNPLHQSRWDAFLKKKKALVNVEYKDAIGRIKTLLEPIVVSINEHSSYDKNWDYN